MAAKRSPGELTFDAANAILMVGLMIVMLYPLLYVALASVSDPSTIVQYRGILLKPLGFTLQAYKLVFADPMIGIGYRNTLFIVVAGTSLNLLMTSLGAYALSRRNVLLRKPLTLMIVFTMYFSGGLIPTYLLVSNTLNMVDSRWALIIPSAINAWNLMVMRTAFESVPVELEEAARIDGANDFTILFRIILPVSLPVVAVMVLFYAVGHWNAFFNAMIYLRTRELFPLQLILREILITNSTDYLSASPGAGDAQAIGETIKYATIVVATLPILCIYPSLQRFFVKGVMIGAIRE